jgi:hypothetical protein
LPAVLRHRQEQLRKGWCLDAVKALQALVLHDVDNHDGWLAMLGNGLRQAPRCLNNLTKPIFGILDGPIATSHGGLLWP